MARSSVWSVAIFAAALAGVSTRVDGAARDAWSFVHWNSSEAQASVALTSAGLTPTKPTPQEMDANSINVEGQPNSPKLATIKFLHSIGGIGITEFLLFQNGRLVGVVSATIDQCAEVEGALKPLYGLPQVTGISFPGQSGKQYEWRYADRDLMFDTFACVIHLAERQAA